MQAMKDCEGLSEKWVSAEDLRKGDVVLLASGKYGKIKAIKRIELKTPETTYNLEVADFHTYYVGENSICVHNAGAPCGGRGVKVTQKGVDKIKNYFTEQNYWDFPENGAMVDRLETALRSGSRLHGADANFYMHELREITYVARGMTPELAHNAALAYYSFSPYSIYHSSVIASYSERFNSNWFNFWGIK